MSCMHTNIHAITWVFESFLVILASSQTLQFYTFLYITPNDVVVLLSHKFPTLYFLFSGVCFPALPHPLPPKT